MSSSENQSISGFHGGVAGSVAACAAGQLSVIQGAQLLLSDPSVNIVLCGATDTPIHPVAFSSFSKIKALCKKYSSPAEASRPFDKLRDGFVMAEGAGMICLEDLDHAIARKAPILAELRGFSTSGLFLFFFWLFAALLNSPLGDGYHMVQPREDGFGATFAMEKALASAGLSAENIDYVAAHATSTPLGK